MDSLRKLSLLSYIFAPPLRFYMNIKMKPVNNTDTANMCLVSYFLRVMVSLLGESAGNDKEHYVTAGNMYYDRS